MLVDLRSVTEERTGGWAVMQIGDDQFVLMEMLARAMGARAAIEVGTFTGTSALAIARGMGPEGRLLCLDVSEEWTAIARDAWAQAGVADRIDLRIAPALDTLQGLPAGEQFDLGRGSAFLGGKNGRRVEKAGVDVAGHDEVRTSAHATLSTLATGHDEGKVSELGVMSITPAKETSPEK